MTRSHSLSDKFRGQLTRSHSLSDRFRRQMTRSHRPSGSFRRQLARSHSPKVSSEDSWCKGTTSFWPESCGKIRMSCSSHTESWPQLCCLWRQSFSRGGFYRMAGGYLSLLVLMAPGEVMDWWFQHNYRTVRKSKQCDLCANCLPWLLDWCADKLNDCINNSVFVKINLLCVHMLCIESRLI